MKPCPHDHLNIHPEHLDQFCSDCKRNKDSWVSLRVCCSCGYVGCCDDSINKHARKHYQETGHPVIKSLDRQDAWRYCYEDEVFLPDDSLNELKNLPQVAKPPNQIIRNFLLISGIYTLANSFIWGVNTLFLMEAGLDILEVFIANAVFTGSMALFEIPTGVLADTKGRRASFLVSVVIVCIGTLGYLLTGIQEGGLIMFCVMSVILGLGFTFYSGAVEAWLVDALQASGYSKQLDRVFSRGSIVSGIAMLIRSVAGGVLGNMDLAYPFVLRALLLMIVFFVAYFTMFDLGFTARKVAFWQIPKEMNKIAHESIRYGWNLISLRFLMSASFVQAIFMAWGFYAWQPYFLDLLNKDLVWVSGIIAALIALSTIVGNAIVEWATRLCGKRTTLMLWAGGIQAVAATGVGLTSNFWFAVPLYLVVMAAMGVWGPVRQAYLHQHIPSAHRASVSSFDALISSGGSMFGQIGLGRIAKVQSIATGYVTGGVTLLFVLPIIILLRRLKEPEDLIVGRAGKSGSCAAQGLPNVSALDTSSSISLEKK